MCSLLLLFSLFLFAPPTVYCCGLCSQAIVALSGAHAVGRCHTDRSGYWGPWTYGETTFSNDYFCRLVDDKEGWAPKTKHQGKAWTGPPQFVNSKGDLMMLHTDMALTWVRLNKCTFSSFEIIYI